MICGLLGRKLGHSYSPQIHDHLGSYQYRLFEKEPEDLEDFLRRGDFVGLNVTMPYKKSVIPYLDRLSPIAGKLAAVNTVIRRDGMLIGHNTDYCGFRTLMEQTGLQLTGKKTLVLGSGGASNTAVALLQDLDAQVIVVSRSGQDNYGNLERHRDAALIVNCTPVGMYPNTGLSPVCLTDFPRLEGIVDVIYNPARTALMLQAEKLDIPCWNGLLMLVAQAKEASEWFTGTNISNDIVENIHSMLRRQMENIILVGMPGCGKTTVGKVLAKALGKEFRDTDQWIEKFTNTPVPQIIREEGVERFRQLETQAISALGKESGLIIATGGGCVTREENYGLLHQNGTIFWLRRDLDLLPTEGRPLSQAGKLEEMYKLRKPMYHRFSDHIIDNNGTLDEAVAQILEVLP